MTGEYTVGHPISIDEGVWMLSFADPNLPNGRQLLGGCLIRTFFFDGAVSRAHQLGINPGGEVVGVRVPAGCMSKFWPFNKLMTREEINALDARQAVEGKPVPGNDLTETDPPKVSTWEVGISERELFK